MLYDLSIHLYGTALRLAAPFNTKARKWVDGRKNWPQRYADQLDNLQGCIWMHCASLGEFEQGRPVLEALRDQHPDTPIVLSFFSPSGFEIRKDYEGADAVIYLPLDTRRNARMLTQLLKPKLALWVKYEFWLNHLHALHEANVPTVLFSGIFRPSQRFFKPWGGRFRKAIRQFSAVYVQDEESQRLLNSIHVNAEVVGDTRFDRVRDIAENGRPVEPVEHFKKGQLCLVAGSTWPADEAMIERYLKERPELALKVILAPHEVNSDHIEAIEKRFDDDCVRYSALRPKSEAQPRVLIIDQIGLLGRIYGSADMAHIGGGFGSGIHNTLEAAVFGIPVSFGPNYAKFREARDLIACGGGVSFERYEAFEAQLDQWAHDPEARIQSGKAAGEYVRSQSGATPKIVQKASQLLKK